VVLFFYAAAMLALAHDFWSVESALQAFSEAEVLKSLSIMGALLMIAAAGSGSVSFDGRSRRAA
jgi:uncharacterized membrane protein YphA (DoxX/SURF4 family)